MKLFVSILFVFCLFLTENNPILDSTHVVYARPDAPAYAKWGRIAMEKTKEKYPKADIIDYLHIGREKGTKSSTEKFKLWLREGGKEFGVFIDIQFENATEKVINIQFRTTSR